MHIRRVRPEDEEMARYVEECWLPYHRDLEDAVSAHTLDVGEDLEDEVAFHVDLFDDPNNRLWVALDEVDDPTAPLAEVDATFAGHLSVSLEPAPEPFESPDRLVIGDFWVRKQYRGTGLADELVARAVQQAREDGCEQLALDVDVDNERALAYYEKLGFEVGRHRMRVASTRLSESLGDRS